MNLDLNVNKYESSSMKFGLIFKRRNNFISEVFSSYYCVKSKNNGRCKSNYKAAASLLPSPTQICASAIFLSPDKNLPFFIRGAVDDMLKKGQV